MKSFTELDAWKTGLKLAKDIYVLTKNFPKEELFALTSQMRRASTSILANLAEGFGKYSYADKAAKFVIARGECTETEALLLISVELGFTTRNDIEYLLHTVQRTGKLLSGLINAARNRSKFPVH